MLARAFGCARVVFNDAIRCRGEAYRAGEKIGPTEVQRRVITEAKTTERRGWLSEVASVALVQAVRDAHRAFSNFFDSVKGRRRGRKVGWPRFKSRKDNRQSFRLTRNGFSLRPDGSVYLAKIGMCGCGGPAICRRNRRRSRSSASRMATTTPHSWRI